MSRSRHAGPLGALLLCLALLAPAAGAQVRGADGAPGPDYWQQQVDYDLEVAVDPAAHALQGRGSMHYYNRSPVTLEILWLQLDQNRFLPGSAALARQPLDADQLAYLSAMEPGVRELVITDERGAVLPYTVRDTYARVELARPLARGESVRLGLAWRISLLDRTRVRARSGYEVLPGGGSIELAAQWYPRAAVFHDDGWQLRPFLGQGEFSLEFGDFRVAIQVPAKYVVAATGELLNAGEVLSEGELRRLGLARSGERQLVSEPGRTASGQRRWEFAAEGVRDFAFAASDRFYWEAGAVMIGERPVLSQVLYPAEGAHLWKAFGLDAIDHSLREYSSRLFDYPWPTATMVNVAGLGMEYPMLGVNGERGTSDEARWDMIGGVIHEVGHNWFPMIVNSNERLYAWMDEGLVAFLEYHIEKAWDPDFLIIYGDPENLGRYRGQPHQQPLMTPADELSHRIDNAYDYAAAALNILRRDVLGPAQFDQALRDYARDWQFRRATATDFFRAVEASSGRDLEAFWRDWFYRVQAGEDSAGQRSAMDVE